MQKPSRTRGRSKSSARRRIATPTPVDDDEDEIDGIARPASPDTQPPIARTRQALRSRANTVSGSSKTPAGTEEAPKKVATKRTRNTKVAQAAVESAIQEPEPQVEMDKISKPTRGGKKAAAVREEEEEEKENSSDVIKPPVRRVRGRKAAASLDMTNSAAVEVRTTRSRTQRKL